MGIVRVVSHNILVINVLLNCNELRSAPYVIVIVRCEIVYRMMRKLYICGFRKFGEKLSLSSSFIKSSVDKYFRISSMPCLDCFRSSLCTYVNYLMQQCYEHVTCLFCYVEKVTKYWELVDYTSLLGFVTLNFLNTYKYETKSRRWSPVFAGTVQRSTLVCIIDT